MITNLDLAIPAAEIIKLVVGHCNSLLWTCWRVVIPTYRSTWLNYQHVLSSVLSKCLCFVDCSLGIEAKPALSLLLVTIRQWLFRISPPGFTCLVWLPACQLYHRRQEEAHQFASYWYWFLQSNDKTCSMTQTYF